MSFKGTLKYFFRSKMVNLWGKILLFRFTKLACVAVLFIMWPIWAKKEMHLEMQENTICTEHAYRVKMNARSRDQSAKLDYNQNQMCFSLNLTFTFHPISQGLKCISPQM